MKVHICDDSGTVIKTIDNVVGTVEEIEAKVNSVPVVFDAVDAEGKAYKLSVLVSPLFAKELAEGKLVGGREDVTEDEDEEEEEEDFLGKADEDEDDLDAEIEEKFNRLLALLRASAEEEEEGEEETVKCKEEEEEEEEEELTSAVKELVDVAKELRRSIQLLKEELGKRTSTRDRDTLIVKAWQPYERVEKDFGGEVKKPEKEEISGLEGESAFVKALLSRLR